MQITVLLHDFKVNWGFVKPWWRNTLFSPSCCCAHFSACNEAVAAMFKQQAFFVVRNRQSPKKCGGIMSKPSPTASTPVGKVKHHVGEDDISWSSSIIAMQGQKKKQKPLTFPREKKNGPLERRRQKKRAGCCQKLLALGGKHGGNEVEQQ